MNNTADLYQYINENQPPLFLELLQKGKNEKKEDANVNKKFNFKNFTNLFPTFNKKLTVEQEKTAEEKIIQEEATKLLNSNALIPFSHLLQHGYVMTKEQEKDFSLKTLALVNNNNNEHEFIQLNQMIEKGLILPKDTIASIFYNSHFIIYAKEYIFHRENEKRKPLPFNPNGSIWDDNMVNSLAKIEKKGWALLANAIGDFLDNDNNKMWLFNYWHHVVEQELKSTSLYSIVEIIEPYCYFENFIFSHLSTEQIKRTHSTLTNLLARLEADKKEEKKGYLSELSQENIKKITTFISRIDLSVISKNHMPTSELLERTKNFYGTHKMSEHQKENYKINTSGMPDDAIKIIHQIETLYQKIQQDKHCVLPSHLFTVDKLFSDRIPEILYKYDVLDDEFKSTMKNHKGQTPKDILIETLQESLDIFKQVNLDLNREKMSSLNVSSKYVSTLKNTL